MYVRYPLSLRNVEDLLHERGIVTDCLASEGAALGVTGAIDKSKQAAG